MCLFGSLRVCLVSVGVVVYLWVCVGLFWYFWVCLGLFGSGCVCFGLFDVFGSGLVFMPFWACLGLVWFGLSGCVLVCLGCFGLFVSGRVCLGVLGLFGFVLLCVGFWSFWVLLGSLAFSVSLGLVGSLGSAGVSFGLIWVCWSLGLLAACAQCSCFGMGSLLRDYSLHRPKRFTSSC